MSERTPLALSLVPCAQVQPMPPTRAVHISFEGKIRKVDTTPAGEVPLASAARVADSVSNYRGPPLDPSSIVLAGKRCEIMRDGRFGFQILPEDDCGLLGRSSHPLIMYGQRTGDAAVCPTARSGASCGT